MITINISIQIQKITFLLFLFIIIYIHCDIPKPSPIITENLELIESQFNIIFPKDYIYKSSHFKNINLTISNIEPLVNWNEREIDDESPQNIYYHNFQIKLIFDLIFEIDSKVFFTVPKLAFSFGLDGLPMKGLSDLTYAVFFPLKYDNFTLYIDKIKDYEFIKDYLEKEKHNLQVYLSYIWTDRLNYIVTNYPKCISRQIFDYLYKYLLYDSYRTFFVKACATNNKSDCLVYIRDFTYDYFEKFGNGYGNVTNISVNLTYENDRAFEEIDVGIHYMVISFDSLEIQFRNKTDWIGNKIVKELFNQILRFYHRLF